MLYEKLYNAIVTHKRALPTFMTQLGGVYKVYLGVFYVINT